jgi:signal transduction histidine kinase
MSKTVNVRVAKSKLLKALKEALDRKVEEANNHAKAEKAQKQAIADIKKSVAALVKSGKLTPKEVSFPYSYRYQSEDINEVTVTFSHKISLPKLESDFSEHRNREAQEELANAIRVLELSDEEYVRTSSYGAVAKYL